MVVCHVGRQVWGGRTEVWGQALFLIWAGVVVVVCIVMNGIWRESASPLIVVEHKLETLGLDGS